VETSMAEGSSALTILNKYAIITFPDSVAKQRAFGQDKWDEAKGDQQKIRKALLVANNIADQAPFKAALLAKGYTQAEIDALATIANNIDLKDILQEGAKTGRPVTTEERLRVLNVVWERDQTLRNCADVVYADDYAKRSIYHLYPSDSDTNTATRQSNIVAGETETVDLDGIEETTETTVHTEIQNTTVNIYFSASENGPPQGNIWNRPAGSVTLAIADFKTLTGYTSLPGPQFLVVVNVGGTNGHYKFTFTHLAE
jgi:hypothetical protein